MNHLPREVEERYGIAKGLIIPVTVTEHQLEMLRTAESESDKGWNILLLIFAGAKILAHGETNSHKLRLPEFRVSDETLDLEDFENALKQRVLDDYGFEIDLSRYLMLAHCTFMSDSPVEGDESDTSSRILHLFTARALNSDDLVEREEPINKAARLVKPAALSNSLQSEWADVRSQLNSGGPTANMRDEYDASWAFVRARMIAIAFQNLFGWELPEI